LDLYEDAKWKVFTEKHLQDWLYKITDILIMQARFASRGFPMSHAELTALINDAFLGWESKDLDLRDGRNEIWNAYNLKFAVNIALPEIKPIGAVTLTNLAKQSTHVQWKYCMAGRKLVCPASTFKTLFTNMTSIGSR
jgi:hypothetical protein